MNQVELKVSGMTCQGCVARVTKLLSAVPGVSSVEVDLVSEQAKLQCEDGISPVDLVSVLKDADYEAEVLSIA